MGLAAMTDVSIVLQGDIGTGDNEKRGANTRRPLDDVTSIDYSTLTSWLLSQSPWMLQCSTVTKVPGPSAVIEKVAWGCV